MTDLKTAKKDILKKQKRDQAEAYKRADFAILAGIIREDKRDDYVKGWLNGSFYK